MKSFYLTPILLVFLLAGTAFAGSSTLSGHKPEPGESFANFALTGSCSQNQADYLGIADATFGLAQVDAPYVLIELFSMYCPFCQKEAPIVNEFYAKLAASPHADRIKMLGIGLGNSQFEVDFFRDKFGVAMPLFPDEEFKVLDAVGSVGTPFFLLVKTDGKGKPPVVVHVNEGPLPDVDAFFKTIIAKTGE